MSGAVWLLTSRGRPELCARAVEACYAAGMTSRLLLYIDGSAKGYDRCFARVHDFRIQLRNGGLAHSMDWALAQYPDATQYGWLADDTFPRTKGWDRKLERAAGDWWLSYAADGWLSEGTVESVASGAILTSGLCWGGDLVRAVGSWVIPERVHQGGIDNAWAHLARELCAHRYTPSVTVEHWNWRTGKRPKDETDDWARDDGWIMEADLAETDRWLRLEEHKRLAQRLLLEMPSEVTRVIDERAVELAGTK